MIYALVPARGGSKSIPMKNIKMVNGKPLIWWVLDAAQNSIIDQVYVATDSDQIRGVVESFCLPKVSVIGRSAYSAADHAKTEIVMEEFCNNFEFDDLVLLQPTSPMLTKQQINDAIYFYLSGDYDSILPVVELTKFIWKEIGGKWVNVNFDKKNRPMRQDADKVILENGYIYIMDRRKFLEDKCRLHGKVGKVVFPEHTLFEPDELEDWDFVETLIEKYR